MRDSAKARQLCLSLLFTSGCIVDGGNPKRPSSAPQQPQAAPVSTVGLLLADPEVNAAAIMFNSDEALTAAAEEGVAATSGAAQPKIIPATVADHQRREATCRILDAQTVEVTKHTTGTNHYVINNHQHPTDYTETRDDTDIGTWSIDAPATLRCNPSGDNVTVDWQHLQGLRHTVQWMDVKSMMIARWTAEQIVDRAGSWQRIGTRSASWQPDATHSNVQTIATIKTTIIDAQKTFTAPKTSGGKAIVTAHITTAPAAPLHFLTLREAADPSLADADATRRQRYYGSDRRRAH